MELSVWLHLWLVPMYVYSFPILISHFCVAFIASMLPLRLFIFNLMVFLSLEYV